MHVLRGIEIEAQKAVVLEKLKANRETHSKIVKEAREGYVVKARAALDRRLDELKSGRLVGLVFSLAPPQDHTEVYDTAITMLELEVSETVQLNSDQVRNLMMDQWDWSDDFLATNAVYSGIARTTLENR